MSLKKRERQRSGNELQRHVCNVLLVGKGVVKCWNKNSWPHLNTHSLARLCKKIWRNLTLYHTFI